MASWLLYSGLAGALVAGSTAHSGADDTCSGAGCDSDSDNMNMLQLNPPKIPLSPLAPATLTPVGAIVQCNLSTGEVPAGSFSDMFCRANMCCPEYSKSFPCPSSSSAWRAWNPCVLKEIQLWPGAPVQEKPKPPAPRVWGAYGPVKLKHKQSVKQFLLNIPGVAKVKILRPGQAGYSDAFNPEVIRNNSHYTDKSYPSIWGDLGSIMQPGFGGLRRFNVVNITPSDTVPLNVYHLAEWSSANPEFMCSIWWGFGSTYETSMVQANQNIATCNNFSAIGSCPMKQEFTAIVGQGWNILPGCYMERGCMTPLGEPTNWVAEQLVMNGVPKPNPNNLQVIIPACQLTGNARKECTACRLPEDQKELAAIPNLVEYFHKEEKAGKCKKDLVKNEASAAETFRPYNPGTDKR